MMCVCIYLIVILVLLAAADQTKQEEERLEVRAAQSLIFQDSLKMGTKYIFRVR